MPSRMPSIMSHNFSEVPRADIQRSTFKRDHGFKTTFDASGLIPIFVDEVLPGDTLNLNMQAFARLATPIFPIMDNIWLDTFFFFVPNRLVWDNWQRFCGEQTTPGASTDFLVPTLANDTNFALGSMGDYFGLPTGVPLDGINALPFRAYNLIFNEWFRDENLVNPLTVPTGDGPDLNSLYPGAVRGKRHDYFTSCLPWPQKGEAVDLPLGTRARIATDGTPPSDVSIWSTAANAYRGMGTLSDVVKLTTTAGLEAKELYADLTDATAATINQLREAFAIQRLYERDARGGTRYTEILKSHFGVTSPDARLQRPEYLGGGTAPVNISAVAKTSSTDATAPQGNLAGFGTLGTRAGFTKSFTEHGYIIGLACARADLTYQQGVDRMWSRKTRWDFYWPALSHLGEQAVLSKEIYADGTAGDETVFGYQERYAEYRYKPSKVTNLFRSNAAGTLHAWHLSQQFASRPTLNSVFIQENVPLDRVIAVPSQPHFLFDSYFSYRCARPMPMYSVPGLIDHF